jgi:demethylmenaquinone methyltransferase / 2-methoxy-6-polyprenyl-1,4-benzoquinol methylase
VWSFGRDAAWRRFLVARVNAIPGSWVLDAASGTGLVARELAERHKVRVAALDQSPNMLLAGAKADRAITPQATIAPVLGRAQRLPFPDGVFDSVTFTYLLRYVEDPAATLVELARVLRRGGVLAGLEFAEPAQPAVRAAWLAYTRAVVPVVGSAFSPAWKRTGRFLGPNISEFCERYPLPVQVRMWQEAGIRHVRTRRMTVGTAVVTWGVKGGYAADA